MRTTPLTRYILVILTALALSACSYQEQESSSALASRRLPAPVLESAQRALVAYDETRAHLVEDELVAAGEAAHRMSAEFREAAGAGEKLPPRLIGVFEQAAERAQAASVASELEEAREAFGEVSRLLLVIASMDSRLAEGLHVFECPMTKTFPKWLQRSEDVANPFMGQAMPACGVASDFSVAAPAPAPEGGAASDIEHAHEGEAAYYTCSMHPSVRKDEPGTCPICSMDLIPVTREEVETGVIFVDGARRQTIGIRTAPVTVGPVSVHIRALGKVVYDETRLSEVSVKYRGWIGALHADKTGGPVRRGEVLFTLYSPELYAAQEELLTALRSQKRAKATAAPGRADYLVAAARKKLRLWDVSEEQIEHIESRGEPIEYLPIRSPVSGRVIEKNVVAGASVEPGRTLYRIAGLDEVWVEAELYEWELPLVAIGRPAQMTLAYLPGRRIAGRVAFIYPYLESESRTGRLRIELDNPGLELKPEMYVNVDLGEELGERLVVPVEAVLYVGTRRLVFVDLGEGRLRPQEVEIGVRSGDFYEVLSGLDEGDVVVTSGNFLVAAESRIKSATKTW